MYGTFPAIFYSVAYGLALYKNSRSKLNIYGENSAVIEVE